MDPWDIASHSEGEGLAADAGGGLATDDPWIIRSPSHSEGEGLVADDGAGLAADAALADDGAGTAVVLWQPPPRAAAPVPLAVRGAGDLGRRGRGRPKGLAGNGAQRRAWKQDRRYRVGTIH